MTMTAPKPRDFRKAPANPNDLRALEPDEPQHESFLSLNAESIARQLNAERYLTLTNAEAAALLTVAHAANQAGVAEGTAKPWLESGIRKLARVIASV